MRLVKAKRYEFSADQIPEKDDLDSGNNDISFVYKPGKDSEFQLIPARKKDPIFDLDHWSGFVVLVIVSTMVILGLVSLVGMELGAVEISISLIASFLLAFWAQFYRFRK